MVKQNNRKKLKHHRKKQADCRTAEVSIISGKAERQVKQWEYMRF